MLPAEFESRKTPGPQGAPQLLFFGCLFTAEAADIDGGIHKRRVDKIFKIATEGWVKLMAPPLPDPLLRSAEERE